MGAVICPRCRKLINDDEPACPYCGLRRPASPWSRLVGSLGGLSEENFVTYVIYLNGAMYVLSLLLSPTGMRLSGNPLTFLSPSDQSLFLLGATGTVPIARAGRWWTLLSANYLHGGILHIFFNMVALRQLAPVTLREYGLHRTVVIYTLGGVLGFAVSFVAGVPFTIGASAAVCALIGALLYYGKSRGGSYGSALFQQVWGWTIGLFLFGFVVPGINNWGHAGGVAAGLLLGRLLGYRERNRDNRAHAVLSQTCIAATLVVLGWAVASSFFYRMMM